ncbi:hypothetical protein P8C59_007173 [Phyllachora maydis]|uniref:Uncharacterized protein n=1 Tax=Phyllachora maydis TaxID=1825666 RepID=A0AAD9MGE9_9PEZI|nr:hypothetical protein P8C59_007173 [Phyllachora maydis]
MATDSNDPPPPPSPPPTADNHEESVTEDFAQALRHIARGEQAASALEANLDTLESKLDELLAAASDTATAQGSVPPGQNGARTNGDSSKEVNGKRNRQKRLSAG